MCALPAAGLCVLYLLQVYLRAVDQAADVGEAEALLEVRQLLVQGADSLVTAEQVGPGHLGHFLQAGRQAGRQTEMEDIVRREA